jgi:hypothetical protein
VLVPFTKMLFLPPFIGKNQPFIDQVWDFVHQENSLETLCWRHFLKFSSKHAI